MQEFPCKHDHLDVHTCLEIWDTKFELCQAYFSKIKLFRTFEYLFAIKLRIFRDINCIQCEIQV